MLNLISKTFIKISFLLIIFFFHVSSGNAYNDTYRCESDNFIIIYQKSHEYLVPHIVESAEKVLTALKPLFHYTPTEKIFIFTNDFHDFGAAGTTTVPQNFIRLDIEPFELDYENIPFNERLQWLISHELVHIIVGDNPARPERLARTLFSKVPPEQEQPISIFYSLLTNHSRYTPDWHQESIAMFVETWLNGGFGRLQGNFDEMFFRSLAMENKKFPSLNALNAKVAHTSYLLQMQYYLYGARFGAYLCYKYGSDKFIEWYQINKNDGYKGYSQKFKTVFGLELNHIWAEFADIEYRFQQRNIDKLKKSPTTFIHTVSKSAYGWVSQPMFDPTCGKIYFGSHKSHELSCIKELNLKDGSSKTTTTLPTPRMVQVAATAIDPDENLIFFTTNNNYLQRDLWQFDIQSKQKKILFENIRVGDLTVCSQTKELWGIHHSNAKVAIALTKYPFTEIGTLSQLPYGTTLQHLAVSPSGKWLAATLHESSGQQKIVIFDTSSLKTQNKFEYVLVANQGSPEHPSWNWDETKLYWNAYVNGVSNIYCYDLQNKQSYAVSHSIRGLFRPIQITADSLFAFEFSTLGFMPVTIPDKKADYLPAIQYFGNSIISKEPALKDLALKSSKTAKSVTYTESTPYNGLKHIGINSVLPILSGFKDQLVLGVYGHLADPLLIHDIKFETGISPHRTSNLMPRYHFDLKYEYKKLWMLRFQSNASNFYDIFNERKRSSIQKKFIVKNTHYWKYDFPHKIKQINSLTAYLGAKAINDNLVKITFPDFFIYQNVLESSNLRRSIGSTDYEYGNMFRATLMSFHLDPNNFQHLGGVHLEWERYSTWKWPHNIFMFKLAAGARYTKDNIAIAKFYFGGFGNRYLENERVYQYRKAFRFPGLPIYNLAANNFLKVMLEEKLPPLRFGEAYFGPHFMDYIDLSIYCSGLFTEQSWDDAWINLGSQVNMHFHHWFNLESTISFGVAKAWNRHQSSWEWFISFKPLKTLN